MPAMTVGLLGLEELRKRCVMILDSAMNLVTYGLYINKVGKDTNAFSFVFWTEITNYYQCFPKGKVELVFLSRKKQWSWLRNQ